VLELPSEGNTSSRTCEPERSLANVDHQDDGRDRGRLVLLLSDRAIFNFDSTKRTRGRLSQEPRAMRTDRTGLVLIEEAVQLLRTAPVTVFALYCGGTVPFLLALFSFCTEMSYTRDAGAKCTASAVIVALAYCWMKGLEVFCCRELVRAYTGNVDRWWEPKTMLSIWSRQIAFQPFGLFIKPLAWLLLFPVTYVSSFFQNLTVLGGARRKDIRKSWELARLWPAQNHTVYGLLSLLALIVFLDLYVVTFSTPFILKTLLGIEGFLTRSYNWSFRRS